MEQQQWLGLGSGWRGREWISIKETGEKYMVELNPIRKIQETKVPEPGMLADYVLGEVEEIVRSLARINKRELSIFIERLKNRDKKRRMSEVERSAHLSQMVEAKREENRDWLEQIGLNPDELYETWSKASEHREALHFTTPASMVVALNAMTLGVFTSHEFIDSMLGFIAGAAIGAQTAVSTSLLISQREMIQRGGSIERYLDRNISVLKRLYNINPDIPQTLRAEFGIRNFGRYAITFLIQQYSEHVRSLPKSKNRALYISAIHDHNGAFSVANHARSTQTILRLFRQGIGVTAIEAGTIWELQELLRKLPVNEYSQCIITSHGTKDEILLSEKDSISRGARSAIVLKTLKERLTEDAEIDLTGCSTAAGEENIAQWVGQVTGKKTRGKTVDAGTKMSVKHGRLVFEPNKGEIVQYEGN